MHVLSAAVFLAVVCNYASATAFPCNEPGLGEGVCQIDLVPIGNDPKEPRKFERAFKDNSPVHKAAPFICSLGTPKCCRPEDVAHIRPGDKVPNENTSKCHDVPIHAQAV
ncbi:hypothetical protein PGT21_021947 [Puccinia graminis f. sp. tritici]|uniref:Hydrophobin n=1 Tax=Puccinia graminis f. sp. tritici TaxID=56615 RepID=A0A5B0P8H6_PUCGR|nr:hypothetical protein PGT21_021947 [Puccinia graminis f. sp. tritici]